MNTPLLPATRHGWRPTHAALMVLCALALACTDEPASSGGGGDSGAGADGNAQVDSGAGADGDAQADTGAPEAGSTDAGSTDAGSTDTGNTDTGSPDAGNTDAGNTDAGNTDAGGTDAGVSDASADDTASPADGTVADAAETQDAGPSGDADDALSPPGDATGAGDATGTGDAGNPDAGSPDAGNPDAGSTDAGSTDAGSAASETPPADKSALKWVQAKAYLQWQGESKVHKSTGPHEYTRTYVNSVLFKSLSAGAKDHPVGAAAVKELRSSLTGPLKGWAITVKTSGGSWYFYESLSLDGSGTIYDNPSFCVGCHKSSKADHFMSPWPLQ